MVTSAAELLAAADRLEARARAATGGPWEVGTTNHPLKSHRTWHLEGVERFRGMTNNVDLGEDEATARYIAMMGPDLGLLLAKVLREVHAEHVDDTGFFTFPDLITAAVLDLARAINRGES